jgi:acetylglutamate kinase
MVQALIDKARVLIEALPYMRRFLDKTIVIKYGGAAMKDAELRASFAVDVVLLKHIGVRPVIVHGGGPQIGATLERLGKVSTFVDGLRVTDDETMDVVEMVLGGKVNREIVDLVQRGGGKAVGLTGSDGGMIRVRRRAKEGRDIGRVGEVVAVDASAITAVADAGFVPVIAPIGVGDDGLTYNVNADEAAGAIAQALQAEKLILLTDVEGVLDAQGALVPELSREEARKAIAEGVIRGGMIPKVECCLAALAGGVPRAHVIDGRVVHAVLLEIFTDRGVGTLLTR